MKNKIKESKKIVQKIHEIIEEMKLNPEITKDNSQVIREVFAAIAATSQEDSTVRIVAMNGIIEIERGYENGRNK